MSQGILYQKLQMLNCCINKKRYRESGETLTHMETDNTQDASADGRATDDEDDEFFECNADETVEFSPKEQSEEKVCNIAEGRLRRLDGHKLLSVDEHLYIPVTQEPTPMTEDMLAEHAEVLTRYG